MGLANFILEEYFGVDEASKLSRYVGSDEYGKEVNRLLKADPSRRQGLKDGKTLDNAFPMGVQMRDVAKGFKKDKNDLSGPSGYDYDKWSMKPGYVYNNLANGNIEAKQYRKRRGEPWGEGTLRDLRMRRDNRVRNKG